MLDEDELPEPEEPDELELELEPELEELSEDLPEDLPDEPDDEPEEEPDDLELPPFLASSTGRKAESARTTG